MEDRRIVQLFWARAESAIDAMQRKYGPRLLATAKNILDSLQGNRQRYIPGRLGRRPAEETGALSGIRV